MVTVKNLIERLKEYPPDLPVYWGYAEEPCWEAKKDAEAQDFPLYLDVDNMGDSFLYFYDKHAVDFEREHAWEIFSRFYNMSLFGHIKYWLRK